MKTLAILSLFLMVGCGEKIERDHDGRPIQDYVGLEKEKLYWIEQSDEYKKKYLSLLYKPVEIETRTSPSAGLTQQTEAQWTAHIVATVPQFANFGDGVPVTRVEYVLFDKTRVDMLTADYAIEVDWSKKWAEAVGQASYYAAITHKKAGILLLLKSDDDMRFVYRCIIAAQRAGIERVWVYHIRKRRLIK